MLNQSYAPFDRNYNDIKDNNNICQITEHDISLSINYLHELLTELYWNMKQPKQEP